MTHDCSKEYGFNGRACVACRERIMANACAIIAGTMPPYNQPEGTRWFDAPNNREYEIRGGQWVQWAAHQQHESDKRVMAEYVAAAPPRYARAPWDIDYSDVVARARLAP